MSGHRTRVGLGAALVAAGVAGLAGCASGQAAGSSSASAAAASTSASTRAVAQQYLQIAEVGNTRLDRDFDGLEDATTLAAARADLIDAAATERRFDASLRALPLPPAVQPTVTALVQANEARASLAAYAAGVASLSALRSYQPGLDALNDPVEDQVSALRRALGLPPPDTDS